MALLLDDPAVFWALVVAATAAGATFRVGLCCVLLLAAVLWRYYPRGSFRETERHGGELVAQVLVAHGVKFVFTLVGGHISPLLVSSKSKGIRIIDVRHEVNAVFAADAVARLTGVPGVAAVTAGPGVTNTITAIKNAQMAQSPLVLIGGAAATVLKGRGALQDIDQMCLLRPLCKYCASCERVKDIVPTLRKAFQMAQTGVPGPVFVELPIDTLYSVQEIRANMGLSLRKRRKDIDAMPPAEKSVWLSKMFVPDEARDRDQGAAAFLATKVPDAPLFFAKDAPAAAAAAVAAANTSAGAKQAKNGGGGGGMPLPVRAFLEFKLRSIFCGAFDKQPLGPLPVRVPEASLASVRKVLAALRDAKRPVLLLGSQATLGGADAAAGLAAAVKVLGVPTFLGGMARGLLGRNHPLHVRQGRRDALKQADLVILAGAVADFRLDYGRSLPKASRGAKVMAINRDTAMLKLNADLFWKPSLALCADPGAFVRALAKTLVDDGVGAGSFAFDEWARGLKAKEEIKEKKNRELGALPAFGQAGLGRDKDRLLNPLQLCFHLEQLLPEDSILVGDGFALGAKLVRPSAEVWLLWGDGSAGYSIAEYDTFVRHNVPVAALIGNDACWTQIDIDDAFVIGKLKEAQQLVSGSGSKQGSKCGVPVVVNAHIGATNFREGSISV
eukprot:g1306.t1